MGQEKMDPVWKAKWVEALRSKEYCQGRNRLCTVRTDGSLCFCATGVLADLLVKEGHGYWADGGKPWRKVFVTGTRQKAYLLSKEARKLTGYHDQIVTVPYGGRVTTIEALNDSGYSFEEIANIIEEQL